jgi:acyl transferase domain-containing protein
MAGRFPGAATVSKFWQNLCQDVESITFFADSDLDTPYLDQALLQNPAYVKAAGILDDIEGFDASYFDFAPAEAQLLSPQHRLFLECCWEALEAAGENPAKSSGRIGVFGGGARND